MRIYFITGLGEDGFVFERLATMLPGRKSILSLWNELPDRHQPGLNVQAFARELSARQGITAGDLVIGHSTGGWVAVHVKQLTGCAVVQLASWTDGGKVIVPVRNRRLIYFAARTGLYLNRPVLRRSLKRFYEGKPSRDLFQTVFLRLITGNRANAVNQLRLIFNPFPQGLTVAPDLRIHALADRIVRPPDEAFVEVPGDHFALYTHAAEVAAPIVSFIRSRWKEEEVE
ncbi:MAG: alpha/beta hydrolase [Chitinophagaceae bacterium]|nr:MAG: alpha/beta hydrolase [Chitinophagaceae bacterium]